MKAKDLKIKRKDMTQLIEAKAANKKATSNNKKQEQKMKKKLEMDTTQLKLSSILPNLKFKLLKAKVNDRSIKVISKSKV